MTSQEKYIARIMLKNKILQSDKQAYEDLFVRVMQNSNSQFQPVKPQGRIGDKKNDGFDKIAGKYYQVYAPEDLQSTEDSALSKIDEDFEGLKTHWTKEGFDIKEYYFVVNDKYKGAYPTLHSKAQEIQTKNKIKAEIFLTKNLEDTFMKLSEDKIFDVVGFIPDGLDIQGIEYDVISEVIRHLMAVNASTAEELIPTSVDYEKKIQFNSLSRAMSDYLNSGHRQIYAVQDYFELNSSFLKDDLRKRFSVLYSQGVSEIPDGETKNDQIFLFIRDKSCPKKTLGIQNAVHILMAYYFECCDIFEAPTS
jgi:hypothetical protein